MTEFQYRDGSPLTREQQQAAARVFENYELTHEQTELAFGMLEQERRVTEGNFYVYTNASAIACEIKYLRREHKI